MAARVRLDVPPLIVHKSEEMQQTAIDVGTAGLYTDQQQAGVYKCSLVWSQLPKRWRNTA